jgi:hypothetical protein
MRCPSYIVHTRKKENTIMSYISEKFAGKEQKISPMDEGNGSNIRRF